LALDAALRVLDDQNASVAEAAIGVMRQFLGGAQGLSVVDRLTLVTIDRERPDSVRGAAFAALGELQSATLGPLVEALTDDPSPAIRALVRPRQEPAQAAGPLAILQRAVAGVLPDDPAALRAALARMAGHLSLPDLATLVDVVRNRERRSSPAQQPAWMAVRASAHLTLAHRGSRLALYDLRETLEAASGPLPVEFIATLIDVGDATCLEATAAAYARAASNEGKGDWWRRHLADAFRVIVAREKVTRRHTAIRKIEKRWPSAMQDLWPAKRGQ
jgi:hypothetical protein